MEISLGLGLVIMDTKEPMGNETELRAPRDTAQMRYFQEKYSMLVVLSVVFGSKPVHSKLEFPIKVEIDEIH